MKKRKNLSLFLSLVITLSLCLGLIGCSKSNTNTSNKDASEKKDFKGTEITALLPPWYKFSDEMLKDFEKETGIKVKLEIMEWDSLVDKVLTSCASGVAPADVTEFSWDWVSKFGKAKWYEPLNKYFDKESLKDITTKDIFKYKDDYLAIPIYNDFRLTYLNTAYFKKAGITENPKNIDELLKAAITMKEKGVVKYPITIPFSATAGTTTPWFLMTKAYGGDLFDENFKPLFLDKDSAGYKAMDFLIKGLKDYKIIDPASVGMQGTDVVESFKNGNSAIDLAGWAGNVSSYTNPKESKIADTLEVIQVPGLNGKSRTYGLHEAIGIPAASTKKDAAAEFIKWLNKPEVVKKLFIELGIFPNHQSTIDQLIKEKKLYGGEAISKAMPTIEPLFKQGAPVWYTEFETDVATTMNQMAKGSLTVDAGLKHIAEKAEKLAKENK
ncbi:ABC transporter substrate-binding protein [Haloimpatiens sp. FM7315]|uniref:ABC transporter substrate-binding protein n=1 Tax=Haloimpatiens sp. FM7315 TaxID=3298609 RepID=UPI00370C9DE8